MKTGFPYASDMTILYVDKEDNRVKSIPERGDEFMIWLKLFRNVYDSKKMEKSLTFSLNSRFCSQNV